MGSVRQIDVPAVLGTPARIVDSDVAVKRKPEHDMARIELEITVTFFRIHRPDTACRSVIAGPMIARCDRCFRHQNAILVAPHFLLGNAHLDVCISDIIGRAVIGRIEVNRVEISLCFVLDRLQKCLRRLLLVDAPAVIAARIQVNGRAKTRFEGMRQPEGVRLIRHMAHKRCRFVLRNRVGSILPLYEPAL